MIGLILGLIFCILLLGISIAANVFLVKALNVQLYKNRVHEQWILELQQTTNTVYNSMKEIDSRGTFVTESGLSDGGLFSKDDDVGALFNQIKDLIMFLDEKAK